MAKALTPLTIASPGYFGLNTQDSPTDMDQRFALQANNCVIDKSGRIACRNGWSAAHDTLAALGTADIQCITELVETDGTSTILCAGNNKLFKMVAGVLTELTYGGGGGAPTITANKWQAATLYNRKAFFQDGHDALVYDPAVSTTTYKRISEQSGYLGTVPQANCVISAFGRLWAADSTALYWSDVLTTQVWATGTSGSLDLSSVWSSGGDVIVALAVHNNALFIFGRRQILVYSGASDPVEMVLSDTISNIGCVNRDTVQLTGEDVIFLSDSGVRSVMRTIQEKSSPIRTISRNVNDEIQQYINSSATANIIAGYSPSDAFYVLTFADNDTSYCFDMKSQLQDGSNRATTWTKITPSAYFYAQDRSFYMGQAGYIGLYSTTKDNGQSYRMSYYTGWIDFGQPIAYAILKKIRMVLNGGFDQTVIFKWGFDYISPIGSRSTLLDKTRSSEYAISEYAIAEYAADNLVSIVSVNGSGTGRVCQIGFESQITDYPISVQKIDIYIKEGRI